VGNTALHKASISGHDNIVLLLLENGADASILNKFGHTASPRRAIKKGHSSVVKILQDEGPNEEYDDNDDNSNNFPEPNFYTRLIEDDDENSAHAKISDLIKLIEDVNHLRMFYTYLCIVARLGLIDEEAQKNYAKEVLMHSVGTTRGMPSYLMFKLIVEKAEEDNLIDHITAIKLSRLAEVDRTQSIDLADTIDLYANSIDWHLEHVSIFLKRVYDADQQNLTSYIATPFLCAVCSAIFASNLGIETKTTMNSIVDFSDIDHIQSIVQYGDDSVQGAVQSGLELLDNNQNGNIPELFADIFNSLPDADEEKPFFAVSVLGYFVEQIHIAAASPANSEIEVLDTDRLSSNLTLLERIDRLIDRVGKKSTKTTVTGKLADLEELCFGTEREGIFTDRILSMEEQVGII